MRALALLAFGLLTPAFDEGDDQYQYVVGLADKGMYERVIKEAERFMREHPAHVKADLARYRLACALFEVKRESEAAAHLRELSKKGGFEFEAEVQFRLGQCQMAGGDCSGAEKSFVRAQSMKKDYLEVPATWMLGEAHLACKHFAEARECYTAVLRATPQGDYAYDAQCGLAWCLFRLGQGDEALRSIEQALVLKPGGAREEEMRFLSGECHLDAQQVAKALEDYRAVKSGPYADAALRGAAFALAETGEHAGAAREFQALLQRFPGSRFSGECALHAGIELLAAKDARGALAILQSDKIGDGAEPLYWRARAESETGASEKALSTLDRALAKTPDRELEARLQTIRGDALAALGRNEEARAAYVRSGSEYALGAAAVAALNGGRFAEAVDLSRKVLARNATGSARIDALVALGEGLFGEKKYRDAEDAFRRAADEDKDGPHAARALSRTAWCRYLSSDAKGAAGLFAEVVRRFPRAPEAEEAGFMSARATESAGKGGDARAAARLYDAYLAQHAEGEHRDEAELRRARLEPDTVCIERLTRFVRERPDSPSAGEAHFEIGERLSAQKRFDEAEPHYRVVAEKDPGSTLASPARYGLAWCAYQRGAWEESARELRLLAGDKGLDERLRLASRELWLWSECKLGRASGILAAWRAFGSTCKEAERLLAAARTACEALKKAGDARACDEVLATLEGSKDPKLAAGVAVERAFLLLDQKKLTEAERELRRALRDAPADPALAEAFFAAGEAQFASGADAQAIDLYEVAAREASFPIADRALYKGGFARLRANDLEGAQRCFEKLVNEHAKSELWGEALFLLGEAQFRAGGFDAAIASLQRLRKEAPRHAVMPKALFRLGLALGKKERFSESAEALSALLRDHPAFENAAEAELWRGRAQAGSKNARGARQAFERVIALDRGALSAQAHIELGRLHLEAQDLDAALSEFLKVAVLYAGDEEVAEALYMAGRTLEAQGDRDQAVKQYREIAEKHAKARFADLARERSSDLEKR